jgi:hypothetical protein
MLLTVASSASAAHYMRLSNGERIHWKSDSQSTTLRSIKVFDNMQNTATGNRWRNFIDGARVDWNSSSLLGLTPQGPLSTDTYNCPIGTKGIVVCNYPNYNGLGSTGPYAGLAEFVLIYSTGHVSRARARLDDFHSRINEQNCLAPPAGTPGPCATYAHAVACQELGHVFGLDHVGGDTCMGNGYFASSAYEVHPNGHDYDAIGSSYGHIDTGSSASGSPSEADSVRASDSGLGADEQRRGAVLDPPPRGNCSRKKVNERVSVERVCGPERQHPDEIRVIIVIPPATLSGP